MLYLSYIGRAKQQWKYMVYAIGVYSLIFGIRYGVGVDFFNYLHNYNAYTTTTNQLSVSQSFEIGFGLLTQFFASVINSHYTLYFGTIAFIQLFFTFLAFKDNHKIYPYIIFTFMIGASWLTYSNGLRHILALSLWIWAVKFMAEKKVWKYYATVALAFTFHTSAILLVVFYPIFHWKNEWFRSVRLELAILVFSLILMKIDIIQNLMQYFDTLFQMTKYDDYTQKDFALQMHSEAKIGLGFLITLILITLLIIYSKKTKEYTKSKYYNIAYDLFIIGVSLKYILINSMIFTRINYYFINFLFIIAAFTMRYAHKNNKPLFYAIICLIAFTFVAVLLNGYDNTALYVFFWQKDLYYLK